MIFIGLGLEMWGRVYLGYGVGVIGWIRVCVRVNTLPDVFSFGEILGLY